MNKTSFTDYFEHRSRPDGSKFWCMRDDRPESLYNLVYQIHKVFDAFPDDWIYQETAYAFEALEEDFDSRPEADCYYSDLCKWLSNWHYALGCCDEAREIGLVAEDAPMWKRIEAGQWHAKGIIYLNVRNYLENQNDAVEEYKED